MREEGGGGGPPSDWGGEGMGDMSLLEQERRNKLHYNDNATLQKYSLFALSAASFSVVVVVVLVLHGHLLHQVAEGELVFVDVLQVRRMDPLMMIGRFEG